MGKAKRLTVLSMSGPKWLNTVISVAAALGSSNIPLSGCRLSSKRVSIGPSQCYTNLPEVKLKAVSISGLGDVMFVQPPLMIATPASRDPLCELSCGDQLGQQLSMSLQEVPRPIETPECSACCSKTHSNQRSLSIILA